MKRLKFLFTMMAMLFMAVAITSCDSKKHEKDDDDDDDDKEKKESKFDKAGKNETDVNLPSEDDSNYSGSVQSGSSASRFCEKLNNLSEAVQDCYTEADFERLQAQNKDYMDEFKNDTTPLTNAEKQEVSVALATLFGVTMDKAIDMSGQQISDEDKYNLGFEIGKQIGNIVMQCNNLSEVCSGMKQLGDAF